MGNDNDTQAQQDQAQTEQPAAKPKRKRSPKDWKCQECGRLMTALQAQKATTGDKGCPGCGSVDIDLATPEELAEAKKAANAKRRGKKSKAKKSDQPTNLAGKGVVEQILDDLDGKPEAEPEPEAEEQIADFLLFIGGNFYTKDSFIEEAARLGISRRMPSHHLPKDLVCGKSRVYVAIGGKRKADTDAHTSEVFGWFSPDAVEFIAGKSKKMYADVIGALKLLPDTRIIGSVAKEAERGCGHRKEGGTYIVVDKADSPLHLLDKPADFEGNHFRGMMRLTAEQSHQFATGGAVSVLVDETCMQCGAAMKCAPDGHVRADRERRRIDKGEEPKWRLMCSECRKRALREKAEARKAAQQAEQQEQEEQADSAA